MNRFKIKLTVLLCVMMFMMPMLGATAENGGGSGGVCKNLLTVWDEDPAKTSLNAGETKDFFLNITNKCSSTQEIKLDSPNAGMKFDPANISLKSNVKIRVKIAITMPAQNGKKEAEFTIKFNCSVGSGRTMKFKVMYKTQVSCQSYVVSWVTNPNGKMADSLKEYTFPLNLANKCSEKLTFNLSSTNTNVKFAKNGFDVEPGKKETINVTIGSLGKKITGKYVYNVTVLAACGVVKKLTFTLIYK